LSLISLNVQLDIKDKIGELGDYFTKCRADVVAVQEAGRTAASSKTTTRGYKQFCHTKGDVCFFVANYLVPFVVPLEATYDAQLWIKITATEGE
jgi:hypothetical protein